MRLLIVVSGAASAMFAPFHLNWLRVAKPHIEPHVILTESACRFVQPLAIKTLLDSRVNVDSWADFAEGTSPHVEIAKWADAAIVHPATFSYVNKFTGGIADSPSLLALHCLQGPIVFGPSFPPKVDPSRWLGRLAGVNNAHILPFAPAFSNGTGESEDSACGPFSSAVEMVETLVD